MHTLICECQIRHKFVLRMPEELQVSLYSRPLVLQGIAAGIGTSNFLRAFSENFFFSKIPHLLGPWSKYLASFLASPSFGFSIAHSRCSFRCDASDMSFHISGHREAGLDVVCFLVSRLPDHAHPSRGFSSKYLEPSEAFPRIWQVSVPTNVPINRRCFSPALHPVTFL